MKQQNGFWMGKKSAIKIFGSFYYFMASNWFSVEIIHDVIVNDCVVFITHPLSHTSSFPYHSIFKIHSTLNNSHCILTKCYSVCCLLKYMSSWAIKILWVHWFFLLMFNNSRKFTYICICMHNTWFFFAKNFQLCKFPFQFEKKRQCSRMNVWFNDSCAIRRKMDMNMFNGWYSMME